MGITVKIINKYRHYTPGQILTLAEQDASHLMAFKFAVPYIEGRETRPVVPPETRIDHVHEPIKLEVIKEEENEKPSTFFKRRGRRKK